MSLFKVGDRVTWWADKRTIGTVLKVDLNKSAFQIGDREMLTVKWDHLIEPCRNRATYHHLFKLNKEFTGDIEFTI